MAQYFFSAAKIQQKKHIRKFLAVNFVFAERLACLNGKNIYFSRIKRIKRIFFLWSKIVLNDSKNICRSQINTNAIILTTKKN